jgi:hypothetical protein
MTMISLKQIALFATLGALTVGACGDDGGSTYSAGGSGGASGGSTSKGGSGGKSGSGGSTAKGGSGNAGEGTDGGAPPSGGTGNEAGAESGGAGGAGPEVVACPTAVAEVTGSYARAICLKQQECCTGDQTLEDCITATQTDLDLIYEALADSVTANRSEISCANFDTCVAAINASECSAWPYSNGAQGGLFVNEPACRQVVVPQLTATTACSQTYECIDGYCATTCQGFNARDASCTSGVCDPISDYCYDHGNADDADDTCEARLANGVPCTSNLQCLSGNCDVDSDMCAAPTECVWLPPNIATTCSTSAAGRSGPLGAMGVGLMLGLAAMGIRRRQRTRA